MTIVPAQGKEADWSNLKYIIESYFSIESFEGKQSAISTSNGFSFYSTLENLAPLTEKLTTLFGFDSEIVNQIRELQYADSFTFRYGSLPDNAKSWQSQSDLVIEAFWNDRTQIAKSLGVDSTTLTRTSDSERVEVGLLSVHPDYSAVGYTWGLTGFSRNLEDTKTEKLLFQYNTHHHPNRGTYSVDFERPTGLHPQHTMFLQNVKSPQEKCSLFAKYTFNKSLFLDKYQLAELNQPTPSREPVGYLYGLWGEADLEAPIWAVDGYGSEALVQIYTKNRHGDSFQFELPTHSRYEVPQTNSSLVGEVQPWPVVFWACQTTQTEKEEHPAPAAFEIPSVGYEAIFPPGTNFHYLQPALEPGQRLESKFDIPVAPYESYETVQLVTVVAIFGCFLYLMYEIFNSVSGPKVSQDKKTK